MILHICSYFYTSKLYTNLFSSIEENNQKQIVFAPIYKKNEKKINSNEIIISPVIFSIFHKLIYPFKVYTAFLFIKKKKLIKNVSIIHAHTLFADGGIAYLLNKKFGIKYIVTVRNSDVNFFWKWFPIYRFFARKVLYNAKNIIFISPSYKENLLKIRSLNKIKLNNNSIIVPNGIDDFYFQNNCIKSKSIDNNRLIYIGNFNSNKNLERIIDVYGILYEKGVINELYLIGKTTKTRYLKKIEKLSKMHLNIRIIDAIYDKEKLVKMICNSKIFIMPSFFETFGLVYVEAMSKGIPIIYSRNQGFDGFFKEGEVGYSVDPNNTEEIVSKIFLILNNYSRISNNCKEKASSFNWHDISKKYIQIYHQ